MTDEKKKWILARAGELRAQRQGISSLYGEPIQDYDSIELLRAAIEIISDLSEKEKRIHEQDTGFFAEMRARQPV